MEKKIFDKKMNKKIVGLILLLTVLISLMVSIGQAGKVKKAATATEVFVSQTQATGVVVRVEGVTFKFKR